MKDSVLNTASDLFYQTLSYYFDHLINHYSFRTAYRNIFQAPVGPPPPGGVPVFPMAPGYYPPSSQTVVVNTTTGAQVSGFVKFYAFILLLDCPPCHLTMVQKFRGALPKALELNF
ncbi:UNVERIFIED_CONTAM: hypothetical protein NCL1_26567 [Trichonephila clavipes]